MRQRSDVLNGLNPQPGGLQSSNGGLTSGAGTLNADLDLHNAKLPGGGGTTLGGALGGKGSTLSRTLKSDSAGGIPANGVAFSVRDGHSGVIKGRINVSNTP